MGEPKRLDLFERFRHLYEAFPEEVVVVEVPELQFAMIDGIVEAGASPAESPEFVAAVEALFTLSQALRLVSRMLPEEPVDYPLMPLEGLWTAPAGSLRGLTGQNGQQWAWTLMIMQPEHITARMFSDAVRELRAEKADLSGPMQKVLDRVRLEHFAEGLCIQTLHVGPYLEEVHALERMGAFAAVHGFSFRGRHHEIYLSEPQNEDPEKLRTILRHPVTRVGV